MWSMLRSLALGLWLGALVAFAFIFAPIAFAQIGATPGFAATIATSIGMLVRAGDWCGILAAAITVFTRLEKRRIAAIIVGGIALAILLGFVETQSIIPAMQAVQPGSRAFAQVHQRSAAIYGVVVLAVVTAFGAASYRSSRMR